MKRRDLLVGSAAAVGAPSAAVAATHPEVKHDAAAMEATLKRVDSRMAFFSELDLTPRPAQNPEEEELFGSRLKLGRAAMRSLYFTGIFMELEEHQRLHPGVQERMRRLQPEMDDAVLGMASLLESMTPADFRALQEEVRKDPDVGMRIGERLQSVAAEDGMGFARRVDLRLAVDEFMRSVRAQNPALVLDPYAKKVRRVQASQLSEAERERTARVKAGEQAFWEFEERSRKHLAQWDTIYATRPRVDLVQIENTYPEYEEHPEDPIASAIRVQRIGGYLFGVGLGTTALGGIFYLLSLGSVGFSGWTVPALVLGVTVGPALIIGGLIVLLVGTFMYLARQKPEPEPTPEAAQQ